MTVNAKDKPLKGDLSVSYVIKDLEEGSRGE